MAVASESTRSPLRSSKEESESASETSSAHSGDVSDRREIDAATQALSSRSEEYRLLFRLPPDEVLVQDFNCAFQESILIQGHMYVFIRHICFYSNIFGFETKKTIPFREVTCVRKAKTAAIFPNAIEITTEAKKHFFGSFLSRDEAYRLIIDGWAQHNNEAQALLDHQESQSENSQDNSIVSVGQVEESAKLTDASSSVERSKDIDGTEQCKFLVNGKNGADENIDNPSFREPLTWKIEDFDAPKIPEHFTFVIEAKFPVCVEEFFTLFISDSASSFTENIHRLCGDKGLQCTPWRQHEQFGHARDLSFLHPVNIYIGTKMGRCQEVQKYRVYKNRHLVIEMSQKISEVPYANYFQVEGIWDVENGKEENSCIMRVYFNVAFSKKTIFKGRIEQSTRDELQEVHAIWINNARELLKQKNLVKQRVMTRDQEAGVGSSSNAEGLVENLHPTMTSVTSQVVPPYRIQTDNLMQGSPISQTSVTSFRETWASLLSYIRSQSHLFPYLAVTIVAILILMQISIIILLTRVPEVHIVTHGNQISSHSLYRSENIELLEMRVEFLKEEMFTVETRLGRMRHEHELLKAHLKSLEQLKHKS